MERASSIIRSSIHSFFTSYHTYASIATVLIFPSSASTLLSKSLIPSSPSSSPFLQFISTQNTPLFYTLYLKFWHTILTFLLSVPSTLTFLCLAKASIIQASVGIHHCKQFSPSLSPFLHLYRKLALTHLFSTFLILSTYAILFFIMLQAFSTVELLSFSSASIVAALSAIGFVLYSAILANVFVMCSLASIVAAVETCSTYEAFVRTWMLIRGKTVVGLYLSLPINLCMAATEVVFQVRVMRQYHQTNQFDLSLMCEGFTITYMYSILTVFEVIINCCFYEYCKYGCFNKYVSLFDYESELAEEKKAGLHV